MADNIQTARIAREGDPSTVQQMAGQRCPQCGETVPVHQGYITWCDHCKWNVVSYQREKPHNLFERLYQRLGKQLGRDQFERMAQASELSPSLTPTKVAAFGVASLVHVLTAILLLLGVATVILTWFHGIVTIIGMVFMAMAWVLRPRITKLPTENIASQQQFPALYALANRISDELGAKHVEMLVLDDYFNASFSRSGWLRKDVLTIGLPLFTILNSQERVALLAHEIAHGANGDPTRGFVVGTALNSLNEWYRMLHPSHVWDPSGVVAFANSVANLIMLAFSQVPRFWLEILAHLMFRDQQRAEYLADYLAARAAGTEGTLNLLQKLHMYDTVHMTVRRHYLNNSKGSLFAALRAQTGNLPPRELERLERVERMEDSRLDATHPPTVYRIDLIKANGLREAQVELSEADNAAINEEIAQIAPAHEAQLLSSVDSSSYY